MKSLNPRIEQLKELMALEERRADLQTELDNLIDQMSSLKDALFSGEYAAEESGARGDTTSNRRGPAPRRKAGRTPRGELKSQIVSALTEAGDAGVRVPELARRLGIKPVNVHSWFHSALRRYPEIKKMERGQYRLEGDISSALQNHTGDSSSSSSTARSARGASRGRRGDTTPHSRRGELSAKILEELNGAGAKGINVRELADKIGAPYKNIYIWFATTGKKNPKVKKLAPATYKLG